MSFFWRSARGRLTFFRFVTLLENLFGSKQPIKRYGKSGINRHLHDDFYNFLSGAAYV